MSFSSPSTVSSNRGGAPPSPPRSDVSDPMFCYHDGHSSGIDSADLSDDSYEIVISPDLAELMRGDVYDSGEDADMVRKSPRPLSSRSYTKPTRQDSAAEDLDRFLDAADDDDLPPMKDFEYLRDLLQAATNARRPKGILRSELPAFDISTITRTSALIHEVARHACCSESFVSVVKRDPVAALLYYEAQRVGLSYACEIINGQDAKIEHQQHFITQLAALDVAQQKHITSLRDEIKVLKCQASAQEEQLADLRDTIEQLTSVHAERDHALAAHMGQVQELIAPYTPRALYNHHATTP